MYCTKCGTRNDDTALTCVQCGNALRPPVFGTPETPPLSQTPQAPIAQAYTQPAPVGQPYTGGPPIPNYLVQAILVTIFCCLPFGVVSIIFAAQVNSKLAIGDIAGAKASSQSAKLWAWVSFGFGLFASVCGMAFMGLGLIANMAKYAHH